MLGEEFMATGEGESTEFLFALKLRDKKICFFLHVQHDWRKTSQKLVLEKWLLNVKIKIPISYYDSHRFMYVKYASAGWKYDLVR